MKTIFHPLLTKTTHRCITVAIVTLLTPLLSSLMAHATLPPEPPKGVSVLNAHGHALRRGILTNCNVDMISLDPDWDSLEPIEGDYHWMEYIDNDLNTIYPYGKTVLLRINTMGGCSPTGKTPPWVFTAMGQPDCTTVTPGVTYSFFDDKDQIWRLIPVFWNTTYLAKKKALIAMAGAHVTANSQFNSQVQVFVISYANAITEDWNIPNDADGSPSEVELWLNDPAGNLPGAGYTTQKMIDAAIHQGDATFTDGVISGTRATLTSVSAVFTQADVTHQIRGRGFPNGTIITAWISPTQVTLSRRARRNAHSFTIVGRRDGLIDVAMAAFPNQYVATAVSGNGPDLDSGCIGYDPGICLAETVNEMARTTYPGRYIVQRNNVTAIIPTKDEATNAWVILADAAEAGMPTAGQALSNCFNDSTYQMNGGNGNNCNHEDPDCAPWSPPCTGSCWISYQQELDYSGQHIATYNASYYEVYYLDASNLGLTNLHALLNPGVICDPYSP